MMRKNIILTLLFGIGLGVFTSIGQSYLPDPLTQLANSYSVWLLFAFACGTLVSRYRWAIMSGAVIQYIALATYYTLIALRFDGLGFNASSNVIWFVGGTLAGPMAGYLGKAYANKSKYAGLASGFMVATILSESLYQFIQLRYVGEGLVFLTLGVLVFCCLLWKRPGHTKKAIISLLALTPMAYIGYAFVLSAIFN